MHVTRGVYALAPALSNRLLGFTEVLGTSQACEGPGRAPPIQGPALPSPPSIGSVGVKKLQKPLILSTD